MNTLDLKPMEIFRIDFDEVKQEVRSDLAHVIESLKRREAEIKNGTRQLEWELVVSFFAAGLAIKHSTSLFEELIALPYFEGKKHTPDKRKVLRMVFLACRVPVLDSPLYKKSCREVSRLQPFFDEETRPKKLLELIIAAKGLNRLSPISSSKSMDACGEGGLGGPIKRVGPSPAKSCEDSSSTQGVSPATPQKTFEVLWGGKEREKWEAAPSGSTSMAIIRKVDNDTMLIEAGAQRL